jgi:hypothetical protein
MSTWFDADAGATVVVVVVVVDALLSALLLLLAPLSVVVVACVLDVATLVDVATSESGGVEVSSEAFSTGAMLCDADDCTDAAIAVGTVDVNVVVTCLAEFPTPGVPLDATDVDDTTKGDGDDEVTIAVPLKFPFAAGACAGATADFSFDTLFLTGAGVCDTAAAASGSIAASDDDDAPPSAAKRSPSEMVSTPAVFIPNALLIAEG